MPFINWPIITKIRRNHGLEHATIHILSRNRQGNLSMVGHSDWGGFTLYGPATPAEIEAAAAEALARLRGGEASLAVHPRCGTVLATTGMLTGLAAFLAVGLDSGSHSRFRWGSLPAAILSATVAAVVAQPLGLHLQRQYTTSDQPGSLEIVGVRAMPGRRVTRIAWIPANDLPVSRPGRFYPHPENRPLLRAQITDPTLADLNITHLGRARSEVRRAASLRDAMPFMADKRLVIVHGFITALKGQAEPIKHLADYFPRIPPTTDLVLTEAEALEAKNPVLKAVLAAGGQVEVFTGPDKNNLRSWIINRAKEFGAVIEPAAAELLGKLVGVELRTLSSELEKLMLYVGGNQRAITKADVELLVPYIEESENFGWPMPLGSATPAWPKTNSTKCWRKIVIRWLFWPVLPPKSGGCWKLRIWPSGECRRRKFRPKKTGGPITP
jgi:hypothetical protein